MNCKSEFVMFVQPEARCVISKYVFCCASHQIGIIVEEEEVLVFYCWLFSQLFLGRPSSCFQVFISTAAACSWKGSQFASQFALPIADQGHHNRCLVCAQQFSVDTLFSKFPFVLVFYVWCKSAKCKLIWIWRQDSHKSSGDKVESFN